MAYTPPTDVRAPMDRRRNLVNKLFQQYQAGRSAGGGTPFRSVTQMPHSPITQMTGNDNVAASIRAQLGPGGYGTPLRSEMSAGPGQPLPIPLPQQLPAAANVPLAIPGSAAPPLPIPVPNVPDPVASTQDATALAPAPAPVTTPTAAPTSDPTQVSAPTSSDRTSISAPITDTWKSSAEISPDSVPLGGGVYYSPTTGYTNPGYTPKLGGAVSNLGAKTPF